VRVRIHLRARRVPRRILEVVLLQVIALPRSDPSLQARLRWLRFLPQPPLARWISTWRSRGPGRWHWCLPVIEKSHTYTLSLLSHRCSHSYSTQTQTHDSSKRRSISYDTNSLLEWLRSGALMCGAYLYCTYLFLPFQLKLQTIAQGFRCTHYSQTSPASLRRAN
jgi:hypothetical protein